MRLGDTSRYPRFGIEEEFFLLDPEAGRSMPFAAAAVEELPARSRARVKREFLASQLEHATGICESATTARDQLLVFRGDLAASATSIGLIAAGVGTAFRHEVQPTLSPGVRYAQLAQRHAALIDEHQVAALHVHVEIPNADAGVHALRTLAAWLPFLKAITGNSPWWGGRDTGFASWRTVLLRRWTTAGCPPAVVNAKEYAARATRLIGIGGTRDAASVAWDIRLSPRYPTIELRVADSQLSADDALTVALLARGLVSSAIRRPAATADFDPELIDAACWHAARFGFSEGVVSSPGSGLSPIDEAIVQVYEALDCSDDDMELIRQTLRRTIDTGTGADRQRSAIATGGWPALRGYLAQVIDAV